MAKNCSADRSTIHSATCSNCHVKICLFWKENLLLLFGKVAQKSSLAQCFCAEGRVVGGSHHLQLILPFPSVLRYCIYFSNAHNQITAFFLIQLISSIQSFSFILGNKDRAIKPKGHHGLRLSQSCLNLNSSGTNKKVIICIISILGLICPPQCGFLWWFYPRGSSVG